jgi:ABC-type polysaccharide/polyol phosphate export permease
MMKSDRPSATGIGDDAIAPSNWFDYIKLGMSLALLDTRLRYRRTTLGPFWVTISFGALVLAVGTIYAEIFGAPTGIGQGGYMTYFAMGLLVWTFATATISEGCMVFVQSGGLIKTLQMPLLLHVYRMMARNMIVLAHNGVVVVLLWLVIQWPVGWGLVLGLLGLLLCVLTLFGVGLVVGVLCTRFRDLQQIVGAMLQLMFLVSPIIWPASSIRGGRAQVLLDFNPVYYMIEVVRGPLLGGSPPLFVWLVAVLITAASISLGAILYARLRHRVAYWL